MSVVIKGVDQAVSEELVGGLIGKCIHVPTNTHMMKTPTGAEGKVNAWFGGRVAGYEKAVVAFDYANSEYYEEPKTFYQILLNDGMGYVLSNEECEILEITEEEFTEMVAEHQAKQALAMEQEDKKVVQLNEGEKKIEVQEKVIALPGRDF